MAKSTGARTHQSSSSPSIAQSETKHEVFAEDLGRLLGEARNRADSWLAQRESIVKHLEGVRDTANQLLQQLGRNLTTAAAGKRGPGRPAKAEAAPRRRKRFTMSAEAREKIAAAQRARWARQKAGKNGKK